MLVKMLGKFPDGNEQEQSILVVSDDKRIKILNFHNIQNVQWMQRSNKARQS